jgi:uncharacterized protein (TIGR00255 family)
MAGDEIEVTLPLASMTGFAREEGLLHRSTLAGEAAEDGAWVWEIRSVNNRGLELRFRLPRGLEALEPSLRELAGRRLRRGSVQASLTLQTGERGALRLNRAWLDALIDVAAELSRRLPDAPPVRIEGLLGLPGVLQSEPQGEGALPGAEQHAPLVAGFGAALGRLAEAREAEGARLGALLLGLLDQFADLHGRAAHAAAAQPAAHLARLERSLGELLRGGVVVAEERLAQEVALLAARSDVQEELDRLGSHLTGARGLLARGGPTGRELDFLVQEFMREINTLCSKSGDISLTALGLQMKALMEQVREQVQNLE